MSCRFATFLFMSQVVFALGGCQTERFKGPTLAEEFKGLSMMQGSTSPTTTVITVLLPVTSTYSYSLHSYSPQGERKELPPPLPQQHLRADNNWKLVTFPMTSLEPNKQYRFRVRDIERNITDEREFKTLSPRLTSPRIAVISCMDDAFDELQREQWTQVWSQKPDVIFLIGDTVYVDGGRHMLKPRTAAHLWQRYVDARLSLELYREKTLIPVFATWDDHDYGKNGGDRHFALRSEAQTIFTTFFPMLASEMLTKGPGVASRLRLAHQNFVFLDNRSFRDSRQDASGHHFGPEQEAWLQGLLKKEGGPFWLISGDQFFGAYHPFDSYEGLHPESFTKFLEAIKRSKKVVAFISGDRHLAEIMKIPKNILGYETYEFTSSGLHARTYPGSLAKTPNLRSLYGRDGVPNYMLLTVSPIAVPAARRDSGGELTSKLTVDVTVLGEKSVPLHQQRFKVAR